MRTVDKSMVIRRTRKNLPRLYLLFVVGLNNRQLHVGRKQRREKFRLFETPMLHHNNGKGKVLRQITEDCLQCMESAERSADDDDLETHQATLRYSRAV